MGSALPTAFPHNLLPFPSLLIPKQHEKQRRPWHFSSTVQQELKHCCVINIAWSKIQKTVHAGYYKENYPNKTQNKICFPILQVVTICLDYSTFQCIVFPKSILPSVVIGNFLSFSICKISHSCSFHLLPIPSGEGEVSEQVFVWELSCQPGPNHRNQKFSSLFLVYACSQQSMNVKHK